MADHERVKGQMSGGASWMVWFDDMEERGRVEEGMRDPCVEWLTRILSRPGRAAALLCSPMNCGSEMMEFHDFETVEKRSSDFTGSLSSISSSSSGGMVLFCAGSEMAATPMVVEWWFVGIGCSGDAHI